MVRSQSERVEIFRSRTQHVFRTRVNLVYCLNSSTTTPEYSLSHRLDYKDFSTPPENSLHARPPRRERWLLPTQEAAAATTTEMETASGRAISATVFIGHGPSSTAEPTCPTCSGGHFEAPSPLPPPAFLNLWPVPCPPQIACPINFFFDDVEDLLHDGEDPFNDEEEDELYDVVLLICMAIGDDRSGASPASKAAADSLPVIWISEELLASDSAQCAVCKDSFELGSSAKQLPCKHLYHAGCILPWLDLRHSYPVYRYELPTDNDDYDRRAR